MKLPEAFLSRTRSLFDGEGEYLAFLASFDAPSRFGIRANPPRMEGAQLPILLESMGIPRPIPPVPWCPDGRFLPPDCAPGRHPLQEAGVFYLQEPSAMLPVEVLSPQPGERVLDLCAAPGGKSVQIAARMEGQGFLLANDVSPDRARVLVKNLERCGVPCAAVVAERPDRLAERLPAYFDRILVDAPCSGEGMFRRDPPSVGRWAEYSDGRCQRLQADILDAAHRLLRPGGRLVYSTCTFAIDEDEGAIAAFLDRHPGYSLVPVPKEGGISDAFDLGRGMSAAARIWPHRAPGDGHFCCCLEKLCPEESSRRPGPLAGEASVFDSLEPDVIAAFLRFASPVLSPEALSRLTGWITGAWYATRSGEHLHVLPVRPPDLLGMNLLKRGFHLGSLKEERLGLRFEPSHSLALVLRKEDLLRTVDLPVEDGTALRYLKGETISVEEETEPLLAGGIAAACVMGFPIGWLRPMGRGMFKNLYPPGWRRQ